LEGPLKHATIRSYESFSTPLLFHSFPDIYGLARTSGWSYGLPDEPQDPDYINILTGNREFRFEAEDVFSKDEDNVSIMSFQNFGAFSGQGWLNGAKEPTLTHLRFNLPISGEYLVKAHLRQEGHLFVIAGEQVTADAENKFTEVTIGRFELQSGAQEILVTLPVNGSIDYISLKAPNLAAITPDGGWQPDEPLTWQVLLSCFQKTPPLWLSRQKL
jgi:hypothetical protein